jgi:GxxExxY protein
MSENDIASLIVDSALEVHRELGPGLLESVYENCLLYELRKRMLEVK